VTQSITITFSNEYADRALWLLFHTIKRASWLLLCLGEAKKLFACKQLGHSYAAFQRAYKEAKTCNKLQQNHNKQHPTSSPSKPLSPTTPKQITPPAAAAGAEIQPILNPLAGTLAPHRLGNQLKLGDGSRQGLATGGVAEGGSSSSSSSSDEEEGGEGGRGGTTRAAAAARGAKQAALTNINMQR
jgi:hypothetical protein